MHLEGSENCLSKYKVCGDGIGALPDDLLIHILSQVPIKDAVTTMVLSKRWRFLWTMVRKLDYSYSWMDTTWHFIDKSLQLHKAPLLESLSIHCGYMYPVDPNVGKCVSHAVNRCVQALKLKLCFSQPQILPDCLYTCKTLVYLSLWKKILVDVPSSVCLPSLQSLDLISVVYKDQNSHVRLLSSCPVLKVLVVVRNNPLDNVTRFSVKVPSLERLTYEDYNSGASGGSLVIESPGLHYLSIYDPFGEKISNHDMPHLDVACVKVVSPYGSQQSRKFLTCFSSVMFLNLGIPEVAFSSAINFSRLIELNLSPYFLDYHFLESLMRLLHNSPKLKVLMIDSTRSGILLLSWNQPSSVPECLLSHLEIFEWEGCGGGREEKEFVAYVLANSKCLKTVGISKEKKEKMMEELESMYRVSASSQLMFSPQLQGRYGDMRNEQWIDYAPCIH